MVDPSQAAVDAANRVEDRIRRLADFKQMIIAYSKSVAPFNAEANFSLRLHMANFEILLDISEIDPELVTLEVRRRERVAEQDRSKIRDSFKDLSEK